MTVSLKKRLSSALAKDFLLDLDDRLRAEALKAFEMVRDRSGLDPKRSRELEGQARFRMMEQAFQEVSELHGGRQLEGGVLPRSELKVFQPFMRFEDKKQGVVLGLATMPESKVIPSKNKSRAAGVSLNFFLSPRLDLDGLGPKVGDVFALLLVCRDRDKAGKIEEVAVGVIGSKYESFLFYEPLEKFLVGSVGKPVKDKTADLESTTQSSSVSLKTRPSSVSLKSKVTPFVPPESPKIEEDEASDSK